MISANSPQLTCLGDTITLSLDIVVLICVAEALFIAFVYLVYYISCRAGGTEGTRTGGESTNLLKVKKENGHNQDMDLQSQSTVFAS